MIHQSIDQCPGIMTGRRMNHHFLRFVDDDQVLILIENLQGDVLRENVDRLRFGH